MMNTYMSNNQMPCNASASCANAAESCAHFASMQSFCIALTLDAMIMASIIVFGINISLAVRLSILVITLATIILVLLGVLLICKKVNMPRMRMFVNC